MTEKSLQQIMNDAMAESMNKTVKSLAHMNAGVTISIGLLKVLKAEIDNSRHPAQGQSPWGKKIDYIIDELKRSMEDAEAELLRSKNNC